MSPFQMALHISGRLFGKVMFFSTYICLLICLLISEGIVRVFGGEGKIFCFRNTNRKILNVHGTHLVCGGHFTLQIKEG